MTPTARLRSDQRPLYVQASEALRNLLRTGGYAPGDRLPSEVELSQRLGISRPTLREALRLLEEEGSISRRHGVGTFVVPPRPVIDAGLEVLESIDRQAERLGLPTRMSDLSIVERDAAETELAGLELQEPAPVTAVTRVISTGQQPIAYLSDVVPQRHLRPSDLGGHFKGSVLDVLLERATPVLSHSRTDLCAEVAEAGMARRLHVQRGSPLLVLEARLYTTDGQVVDYSNSYFVPGHFRFHVVRRIG